MVNDKLLAAVEESCLCDPAIWTIEGVFLSIISIDRSRAEGPIHRWHGGQLFPLIRKS
jgi:hypothetical protein